MKKVKTILGATILIASIALTGCAKEGDSAYEIFEVYKRFSDSSYELIDKKTGIHYYFLNTGYGKALTPVIESDGSIRGAKSTDKLSEIDNINKQIKDLETQKEKLENNK